MISPSTRGVYFLANNKIIELAIAFLNSFREHNPTIPLCLIPYDDNVDQILALRDKYSFTLFEDQDLLRACDVISEKFHGKTLGAYRKLVAWEGKFDEFAYVDTDTVVVDNIDFVFENLEHTEIFTSHSNIPALRKWVWKDSIESKKALSREQMAFSANTGFFVSKAKLLDMTYIQSQVDAALELKDDMELHCMEQPFLNYLIVTSNFSYGSLLTFYQSGVNRRVKFEWWAGRPGGIVKGGRLTARRSLPVFLVHWAGLWQSGNGSLVEIPYKKLWDYYRFPELRHEQALVQPSWGERLRLGIRRLLMV